MSAPAAPLAVGHVVLSLDVGGLERVVATLARAQHEAGARVVVYCLDGAGVLAQPLPAAGVPVRVVHRRARGIDARAVLRLARMLRRDAVTIVHCHNHAAMVYGALAARLAARPRVVYTVHGARTSARRATGRWQRMGLLREVVFVSRHARDVARVAGTRAHTHVVTNGVDSSAFALDRAAGERVRRELGIAPDARVCGIVARLTPAKDHRTLFEAVRRLREAGSGVHCIVVGDGEMRGALESAVRALGLDDLVHFTGARANVRDYLGAMDVFVLSSVTEGLAMTLLEAMAAGKPVVATRVGGNPEVVEDGRTGLLVSPGDPDALASAVDTILRRPELQAAMGAAGRDRARRNFSLEAMLAGYAAVYAAAMGAPAR
jgi:glycosyltransferase involved in cell wall biosynthesis